METELNNFVQMCTEASLDDGKFEWKAAGMGYIIRTPGDRLIVIDGGEKKNDAIHLISLMNILTPGKKPVVALWILTHPHPDHYGALKQIEKDPSLQEQLTIENICYQLPEGGIIPASGYSFANAANDVAEIVKCLHTGVVTPHTNDVLDIDGYKIRFFFTPEDCFENLKDPNELSLIFRIEGKEKTVMFTGDAYEKTARFTALRFWDELKSDFCQLAHHGLNGGSGEFYMKVDAPIVLIPISKCGDKEVATWFPGKCPRQFGEKNAKESVKAYEGDRFFRI